MGYGSQVFNIFRFQKRILIMFSINESKLRLSFEISSDFDLHFEAILLNIDNNTNDFSIIYIDNIIILQISLDCLIIDSDVSWFWSFPELTTCHRRYWACSYFQKSLFIIDMRHSDFSPSYFYHESTILMGS